MKKQMDRLLLAALAPYATYNEKQLLKAGQLGTCAAQILQRRRKTAQFFWWTFIAMLLVPVVIQLTALVFQPSNYDASVIFSQFSFIALLQVPMLVEVRLSQSRLETLIAMWLLTDEDDSEDDPTTENAMLSQLVFGHS